jgi:capsid protein
MSLATRIESLVLRVAQEFNDVRTKAGNLTNLTTTDKSNLVAAINELKAAVSAATDINDAQVSVSSTYSSSKIVSLLNTLKSEILGGADAAYDTLVEIQQLLQNGTSGLDALLGAVNNRVRFDSAQVLTVPQQVQARANIGAVAATDIGNTETDFVAVFTGALTP